MWDSFSRGQKLASITLAVELVLALGLTSPSLGLFALMAMPFVGLAWLPAGALMFSDLRDQPERRTVGYLAAVMSVTLGLLCLFVVAQWTLLATRA